MDVLKIALNRREALLAEMKILEDFISRAMSLLQARKPGEAAQTDGQAGYRDRGRKTSAREVMNLLHKKSSRVVRPELFATTASPHSIFDLESDTFLFNS